MKIFILSVVFAIIIGLSNACTPSPTTVSGTKAPTTSFCSGDLIFEDNFDTLDKTKWRNEVSLWGGGNGEFQWYVNDTQNSYTADGALHLKPTFTADVFGETFLRSGRVVIPPEECTQAALDGCDRQGMPDSIINPIRSARVDTWDSFHFKYGTVEIRAKNPGGDWIWPAIWLMPRFAEYGDWPTSGEIDLMETRGNRHLYNSDKVNVGVEQVGSTLHFGPDPGHNAWWTAHFERNRIPGLNEGYHVYKLIWTPTLLQFQVDGSVIGTVDAKRGFWQRGFFEESGLPNPWTGGTIMAPFDKEFFIIMNCAVGGTGGYFPEDFINRNDPKPWTNNSPRAATDFWESRSVWEPTWNKETDDSHVKVDYVRVWAL